jgi:lipoprotein-releasing system permease protein
VSDKARGVEGWLAWRYLANRQREGFVSAIALFSLVGVALGVATLIVVLSVMGGFREQLISRIIGMNGHVVVAGKDDMVEATPELLEKLRTAPGVKNVRLTLERQALVSANGQTRGAVLRGVRVEDLMSREIVTRNIVTGALGDFNTKRGVVMGDRLRMSLNLRVGDTISVVTHKLSETGAIAPRSSDYVVLASFVTKRYEFDSAIVFVPLQMLQDDLEYDHRTVSSIDLELNDPADAPQVAAGLRKTLGRDDLKISDWQSLNARFMGALQLERVMMFIILSLIVLVAALNVIASFTMLVRMKRGNIAILRTMGAGPGTIIRAFFMAAAAVGLAGTATGTAVGLYVCSQMPAIGRWLGGVTSPGAGAAEVDFVTSMPVRVEPREVIAIIAVAILLSLAAAAYPAWRSARVEPVEGLRHE